MGTNRYCGHFCDNSSDKLWRETKIIHNGTYSVYLLPVRTVSWAELKWLCRMHVIVIAMLPPLQSRGERESESCLVHLLVRDQMMHLCAHYEKPCDLCPVSRGHQCTVCTVMPWTERLTDHRDGINRTKLKINEAHGHHSPCHADRPSLWQRQLNILNIQSDHR